MKKNRLYFVTLVLSAAMTFGSVFGVYGASGKAPVKTGNAKAEIEEEIKEETKEEAAERKNGTEKEETESRKSPDDKFKLYYGSMEDSKEESKPEPFEKPGVIRISFDIYDADTELDRVLDAIRIIAGEDEEKPDKAEIDDNADVNDKKDAEEKADIKENADDKDKAGVKEDKNQNTDVLSLWTDESETKVALTAFMDAITDERSEDFIPVEDRIAVFDFDGTLFCETDPNYFDYMLLVHRVLEDPDYKDKASRFEKETALKIVSQNETGESFEGLETDHGKCIASSFAGMTLDEFSDYIQEFKKEPMISYEGMNRGDGWYLPMLQVIDYLEDNDFKVYIISGTDRFIVRGIFKDSAVTLPPGQIIGSDENVVATGQGDTDGLKYTFAKDDEVVLGGDFLIKDLKMNKVSAIVREIGQQPVLSFGNSTGDSSMAEYVITDNDYRSLAFMLCCDDTERENGKEEKAGKMYDLCEEFGWIPVSMKNDWTTIYGDNVTYTGNKTDSGRLKK